MGVAVKAKKLRLGCRPRDCMTCVQAVLPVRLVLAVVCGSGAEDGLQLARCLAGLAGVRLVHDDGVAALRDRRFPFPAPAASPPRSLSPGSRAGDVQQSAQHEREFLQCRDDDLGAVNQRRRELLRVLIDGLDDALRVFDLVDRVLQLLVEHAPIGDDDDAVEDLFVGCASCRLASRCESHEMLLVLPLPAECWIR